MINKICKGLDESICKDCKFLSKSVQKIIRRPSSNSLVRLDKAIYSCTNNCFKDKSKQEIRKKRCKKKIMKEE